MTMKLQNDISYDLGFFHYLISVEVLLFFRLHFNCKSDCPKCILLFVPRNATLCNIVQALHKRLSTWKQSRLLIETILHYVLFIFW